MKQPLFRMCFIFALRQILAPHNTRIFTAATTRDHFHSPHCTLSPAAIEADFPCSEMRVRSVFRRRRLLCTELMYLYIYETKQSGCKHRHKEWKRESLKININAGIYAHILVVDKHIYVRSPFCARVFWFKTNPNRSPRFSTRGRARFALVRILYFAFLMQQSRIYIPVDGKCEIRRNRSIFSLCTKTILN